MDHQPRALFIFENGIVLPDNLICSGRAPSILSGQPCPFSDNGRFPLPQPLQVDAPTYSIDKGLPGDLCPPCCKQVLGSLGDWHGHHGRRYPDDLHALRLFKCRQWFWVVVPGLKHDNPQTIQGVVSHGE